MLSRLRNAGFALGLGLLPHVGLAAPPAPNAPPAEDAVDITASKPNLKVISDGKGHVVVVEPFGADFEANFFYGDGKTFYLQRVFGGGSSGHESFDKNIWDPRERGTSLDFRDGKYVMSCGERKTELKEVAPDEAKKILDGAKFYKPRWKRQAYALARDNTGKYYYVDRAREPEGNKQFRLFAGVKGSLKLQKMTNVVSDSEGDIFATKTGELRLVLNKSETLWQRAGKQTKLIFLPVEDNHQLIYSELGVYTGERLGTPCDDL